MAIQNRDLANEWLDKHAADFAEAFRILTPLRMTFPTGSIIWILPNAWYEEKLFSQTHALDATIMGLGVRFANIDHIMIAIQC